MKVNTDVFLVKSQSSSSSYRVNRTESGLWACTCTDYARQKIACKHIAAVGFAQMLPHLLALNKQAVVVICPTCGSVYFPKTPAASALPRPKLTRS